MGGYEANQKLRASNAVSFHDVFNPADERLRAHAFTSDDGKFLGFSRDPAGSDLPLGTGVSRWQHYAAFDLGAHRNTPL